MAEKIYVDHRKLTEWRKACEKILPLEPFIPSRDGFVLTQDDRLAFRFMLNGLAKEHGAKGGLTVEEAYAFMARIENMPAIEEVVLTAQRDVFILRRELQSLRDTLASGGTVTPKQLVKAAQVLRETE